MQQHIHYASFSSALVQRGVLEQEQLNQVENDAENAKVPLERYLIQRNLVAMDKFVMAAAAYFGIAPIVLPPSYMPAQNFHGVGTLDFWQRVKALPFIKVGNYLSVVFGDPFDLMAQEDVARVAKMKIIPLVAAERDVTDSLMRLKGILDSENPALAMENVMKGQDADIEFTNVSQKEELLDNALETAEEAPVIRMVNMMLLEALKTNASDIHFEAMEKISRLRYRIDGELVERPCPPKSLHNAIVSRIKIMADLDIAEHRNPQDGRFKVKALKKEVDIRVSILPTIHGEKVVMRTLDKSNLAPGLAQLGLDDFAYTAMKHAIDQPHGIILVTGPTGSGKTTTLYSCLQDLNRPNVNIITAEDPVEYELPGVNQVYVNAQVGLTFASVLRSVLRQDPDIVLVGEIRDGETADIAVKAALTGHLVLSTLHTNDAVGVIARLLDMGIPPFLLSSSLILAQAQRLFRRICPFCRLPVPTDVAMLKANHVDPAFFEGTTIYDANPKGCTKCHNGYKGRGAVMEVLPITDAIRTVIAKGAESTILRQLALDEGMVTLKQAGMMKVKAGITSLNAAIEVTGDE